MIAAFVREDDWAFVAWSLETGETALIVTAPVEHRAECRGRCLSEVHQRFPGSARASA